MRITAYACLLVLIVVAFGPAVTRAEDAPSDASPAALALIDRGRAALVAGRAQEAIDSLQKAIGIIQATVAKTLSSFLVDAVGELEGDEVDVQSGAWGAGESGFQWNSATRTYRPAPEAEASDPNLSVEVMISNSPQLLQVHKASLEVYGNPQMRALMERSGGVKIETIQDGPWEGIFLAKPGEGAQALAFTGSLMLQIQSSAGDLDLVKRFWKAIDTAGLAKAK